MSNTIELEGMTSLSLQDLKLLKPAELIQFAEKVGVENAGSMRKQDIFVRVMNVWLRMKFKLMEAEFLRFYKMDLDF